MFQKGGSSRSNRLRLLPFDKVEHVLRRALLRYAQIAQLATHARYLHALQCTRGFVSPKRRGLVFQKDGFHFTKRRVYLMGLNRVCSMVVQWLFNGCSMIVQWLANGCHHALWSLVSAESMNAIHFLLRRGRDFAWNEWNGVNGSGMGVNGSGTGNAPPCIFDEVFGSNQGDYLTLPPKCGVSTKQLVCWDAKKHF